MIRRPSRRARRAQWVVLAAILLLAGFLVKQASDRLAERGMHFSYNYLGAPANFDIPFRLIDWSVRDSFGRVLLVGLLNTLLVSVLGIVAATLLGLLVGVMRLSVNGLLRLLAAGFVEGVRNTPQLIQIVFWYAVILQALPIPRFSLSLPPGLLLNVRGLYVPRPDLSPEATWLLPLAAMLLAGGIVAVARRGPRWVWFPLAACAVAAAAIRQFDFPVPGAFNVRGGTVLPPELLALWLGLSIYSAAFIAEIIRGAIQSVPYGQVEAAQALGLRPRRVLVSIVLPQALRLAIPPITSQYLNLVKSSSLGAAIAYPELFQIFAGTALNQSGREIETMSLVAAVFLSISLGIAALMNWYNRRMALPQR